jgi:hypothetical protein
MEGDFQQPQILFQPTEVLGALWTEMVDALWSGIGYLLAGRLLAIEQPEGISLYPALAVRAKVTKESGVVVLQVGLIAGAALFAADAVKLE